MTGRDRRGPTAVLRSVSKLENRLLANGSLLNYEAATSHSVTVRVTDSGGLTYDEAAEALGIPPGTVRSRMKRGRTMLQKALWEQARDAGIAPLQKTAGIRHEQ